MLRADSSKTILASLLTEVEPGFKKPTDVFFEEGNKFLASFVKQGVVPSIDEQELHPKKTVMCNVPGCGENFDTVYAYQTHYNSLHRHLCQFCKKSLPSDHLLDLHISEQHDSYFAVQAKNQPMYLCFLEECKTKFSTPEERKDHCIKDHKFPANFRFDQCHVSPKRSSQKQKAEEVLSTETESSDMDTGDTGESSSDSKKEDSGCMKVLKGFSFGHQRVKAFDSSSVKKTKLKRTGKASTSKEQQSVLEDPQTTAELMDSLPAPSDP